MAGSLSRNISLKVPNPTEVSVHVAGSLSQNYTWRDHSVRITRGGITQSKYFTKGPQSHRGLGSRGGITQSELHVAGSLSLNISIKVPISTGVIPRGGITQSEFSYKSLQLEVCWHTPRHHVAGSLSLITIFFAMIIICVFEKQITVAFALLVTFVFALQIKCCLKTIDNSHFCTTNNVEVYNTYDRCICKTKGYHRS